MSFSSDVHKIAERMGEKAEDVANATFIELFNAVIKDTPVDSGRLQGNWQTTRINPANGQLDRFGESAPIADVFSTINKPDRYFLTNNLPYAERIEFDGWSRTKAPRGMVRINVKRLNQILRKKASGLT